MHAHFEVEMNIMALIMMDAIFGLHLQEVFRDFQVNFKTLENQPVKYNTNKK